MSLDPHQRVIRRLAARLTAAITRGAMRELQRGPALLSGEDSGLRNAWEEIVVEVRHEHSIDWWAYKETVEGAVRRRFVQLSPPERQAMWLATPRGEGWLFGRDDEADDDLPHDDEDVVEHLCSLVYSAADEFSNARVEQYLARRCHSH
jgi:hypothetical protein